MAPNLALADQDVHVWCADLDPVGANCEILVETLSPDEQARAARFHFDQHRNRFIAARWSLRGILGSYLNATPAEIVFAYGAQGKPLLAGDLAASPIQFNLAHSQNLALIAVTRGRDIGVDVEAMRPMTELKEIARRFFSPAEAERLEKVPEADQVRAFFTCWTRKEAYIKATGLGISAGLDKFEVSFSPHDPPALLRHYADPHEPGQWTLFHLEPAAGFIGAIAARELGLHLRSWRWPAEAAARNL